MTRETARARRNDPWTSWAAARSVGDLTVTRAAVLHLMVTVFPKGATLDQAVEAYKEEMGTWRQAYPLQSDSGIRSRVSELVTLELVKDTGRTKPTASGRQARILIAAEHADPQGQLDV